MAAEETEANIAQTLDLSLSLSPKQSASLSSAGLSASEHLFPSLIERSSTKCRESGVLSLCEQNSGEGGIGRMDDGGFLEMLGATEEDGGGFLLCFDGAEEDSALLPLHGVLLSRRSTENSSISSLSSSPPSTMKGGGGGNCLKMPKKEVRGGGVDAGRRSPRVTTAMAAIKKSKTEGSASAGHGSSSGSKVVSKEKLGDRIVALQQLVSPFGKTDTASVLLEALGYIRFLHDQIQVLSSPYLQGLPFADHHIQDGGENDLRRHGLCLVPVSCTEHVTGSNGADLWSPGMGIGIGMGMRSSSSGRSESSSFSKSKSNSKH